MQAHSWGHPTVSWDIAGTEGTVCCNLASRAFFCLFLQIQCEQEREVMVPCLAASKTHYNTLLGSSCLLVGGSFSLTLKMNFTGFFVRHNGELAGAWVWSVFVCAVLVILKISYLPLWIFSLVIISRLAFVWKRQKTWKGSIVLFSGRLYVSVSQAKIPFSFYLPHTQDKMG